MGELTFFLGLQVKQKEDGLFISQDKYVNKILNKFSFSNVKTASKPMDTHKALLKDEKQEVVDEHLYRSMIGSLMYLTSLRLDIMFTICACVRFQVNPKISHLHVVKRIFRYLKGQPKLGLWYPKDSPFDLVAYTNNDYARVSLDRKSTTGGCQFLKNRLISLQCKKQTVVANSTTKAEEGCLEWYGKAAKVEIGINLLLLVMVNAVEDPTDPHQLGHMLYPLHFSNHDGASSRRNRLSARVESFIDEQSLGEEDASKQGRISDIDVNQDIYLVNVHRDEDIFGVNDQDDTLIFDADKDLQGKEVVVEKEVAGKDVSAVEEVNAASIATSITATTTTAATTPTISMDEITLAKALIEIKTSRHKAKGIVMQEPSDTSTPTLIVSSQQPSKVQDKYYELAERLQAEEQEQLTDAETAKLFMEFTEQRIKFFTANKLLKKFDKEDLEALWRLVKERFVKTKPVDNMDSFLMHTLKTMFEHHVKDTVWKSQQGLTKLQVDDDCEMAYELVKKQPKEGYRAI
uniref:Uncharacterized mitochondrial protein AtMg00810-like n=1 Tax=Tanacetum cinerariifolium TaxID=118510 RepID=A0A6L2JC15_TANCI|nr:uncharacterized mitochondrial protein AtMg00810-like [Tanacetum cinerariifolium]